jgi:ATP-dependent DNA helicase DinG
MESLDSSVRALLSAQGPFARLLDGFDVRAEQQDMADEISTAIKEGTSLLCEAGTGTGKTLAYLVPSLALGHKTIISTATKTLQDQLFFRDIPLAIKALESVAQVALLKGRANYLCLYRLKMQDGARDLFGYQQREVAKIKEWGHQTASGDITTFSDVADSAPVWPKVTSTVDNCLGQNCDFFEDCFVVRARREAVNADLVVVNHHLLFADMALKEEGFGELLPTAEVVVLDEAHQIPDIAANFFGDSVSSFQLREFARDALLAQGTEAPDDPQLRSALECIDVVSDELQSAFASNARSGEWHEVMADTKIRSAFDEIINITAMVDQQLETASVRGPMLDSCFNRIQRMRQRMALFDRDEPVVNSPGANSPNANSSGENAGDGRDSREWVRWWETSKRGFIFHATPVSVAEQFANMLKHYPASWIFTSATLSVAGDFKYFQHQLGLNDIKTENWASPFNYEQSGLMYLPKISREPRETEYISEVISAVMPIIEASKGRVFILFTSHRALTEAANLLRDSLEFPLLIQGEGSRAHLIDEFQRLGNAVLLGTGTFWQGVDVRGSALSVVVIDKLPFAPPNDPLTKARIRAIEEAGGSGFRDFQVPEAVITLKQGAGRLIRDDNDRGVLMLCDPRLQTKSYGKTFLQALPPMIRTSSLDDVLALLAEI